MSVPKTRAKADAAAPAKRKPRKQSIPRTTAKPPRGKRLPSASGKPPPPVINLPSKERRARQVEFIAKYAKIVEEHIDPEDEPTLHLILANKHSNTDYMPEFGAIATKLCMLGHSDKELAMFFGVSVQTISTWLRTVAPFKEAVLRGREVADAQVARALYMRAVGCSVPDAHVSNFMGEITVTELRKYFPPDPAAQAVIATARRASAFIVRTAATIERS